MNGKVLSILGSTGSIGTQTLDVCRMHGLRPAALTGGRNVDLLEAQAREFRPDFVALYDEGCARDLKIRLGDTSIRVAGGMGGLLEAAAIPAADVVVTAVVGTAGLRPTLAAIDAGKTIALANKETLVCAGELVMARARAKGVEILPVDSEHSAIFQCLSARENRVYKTIWLTASGGPFFGKTAAELENVTAEAALRHPNWSMGAKVTIDSATMMNKGLEFIEAMHLFSAPPEKIRVLVHPQSIVHSLVEFPDHSVIAQLGVPDMRVPIQYALTYPARAASPAGALDLVSAGALTFFEPDLDTFPCLRLAMETARIPGTACAVLNGANEAAVARFLSGRARFGDIYALTRLALEKIRNIEAPTLEDILAADAEAKAIVERN